MSNSTRILNIVLLMTMGLNGVLTARTESDAPMVVQPIISEDSKNGAAPEQANSSVLAPEVDADLLDKQAEEMIFRQMFQKFNHYLIETVFSKFAVLKLAVSSGKVKLTKKEQLAFFEQEKNIREVLLANFSYYLADDMSSLSVAAALNTALIQHLALLVKSNLKKSPQFKFTPATRSQISREDLEKQIQNIQQHLDAFENAFKDLGITHMERIKRRFGLINHQYGINSKLKTAAIAALLLGIARYKWKPDPADPDYNLPENPTWYQRLWHKHIPYIDELLGVKPIFEWGLDHNGNRAYRVVRPGSGIGGTIHQNFTDFLFLATFATFMRKTVDEIAEAVTHWKGAHRDPAGFVKAREIFNNEKQNVSPFEELFLARVIEQRLPRFTFEDIAGLHEQKKALMPVIQYLLDPDLYEKIGTTVEKGYLLYGPTRTGKTYLAEALAGEILKHKKNLAFLELKSDELRVIGIKKVMEVVQKYAPCIVFIDELDLLNLQRDSNATLLEEFLTGMRASDNSKQVIILAATNRIDHLDHALLQPGRFGKIITFENPSFADRKEFFKKELMRRHMYDPTLDLDQLSRETEQCNFGMLASILNDAINLATQRNQALSYGHFDKSIDMAKRKIIDTPVSIRDEQERIALPENEKQMIAAHLAGMAFAFMKLNTNEKLHKVTMLPIQKKVTEEKIWLSEHTSAAKKITIFGDIFTLHELNTGGFDTQEHRINRVKAYLAGFAAEKVLIGSSAHSYRPEDLEQAYKLVESMVLKGLKKDQFSRDAADRKMDEIMNRMNQYEEEITELLIENKETVSRITEALRTRLTLTGDELAQLMKDDLSPLMKSAAAA